MADFLDVINVLIPIIGAVAASVIIFFGARMIGDRELKKIRPEEDLRDDN